MADHRLKVGQLVQPAGRAALHEALPTYEIVSLLPSEGQEARYRVKLQNGSLERVVEESKLTVVAEAPVVSDRPSISISGSKRK